MRQRELKVPIVAWAKDGYIDFSGRKRVNYDVIQEKILELREKFRFRELAYDPHNAQSVANSLEAAGVECYSLAQTTANFSEPVRLFGSALHHGKMRHGSNPVLSWAFAGTQGQTDMQGHTRPVKVKSTAKIDPIVSTLMAFARAILAPEKRPHPYARGYFVKGKDEE